MTMTLLVTAPIWAHLHAIAHIFAMLLAGAWAFWMGATALHQKGDREGR